MDSTSSCCVFNVEEEVVVIRNGWTPKKKNIVLAYLMLFAALTNAVCLYSASFFAIDFCKCFLFSCFVFVY